jgi:hypothetical protein
VLNDNKDIIVKLIFSLFIISTFFLQTGCGDSDNPVENNFADINIIVKSSTDSAVIPGANVILYNASNGNVLRRISSAANGVSMFEDVDPGTFYVRISAQNFNELPPVNFSPLPFSAGAGNTLTFTYYLSPRDGQAGMISGYVNPPVGGILIKASEQMGNCYSSYSGPDGYYVIFNVPYGTYNLGAAKNGYRSDSLYQVNISQSNQHRNQDINIYQVTGAALSGSVTFLAVNNGIVDVSILDRETKSAINGLSTVINESRLYNLAGIPKGEYLAWASFKNDGFVMDPDWIYRNPGGLNISFPADSGSKALNFSVTGAVKLLSPTNPADSIIPAEIDTLEPMFMWNAYPQTKEYIIEVKDLNGNIIWGGYNSAGVIQHAVIPKEVTSVRFNFDGSASAQLKRGEVYQWKIYSDNDAVQNIQTLLSSSEDLMGLFKVK